MATKKWKYWVGHLILDKGGRYPHPGANGPRIDRPVCKPGSTMPVSSWSFWGMLTTDIKQVERWEEAGLVIRYTQPNSLVRLESSELNHPAAAYLATIGTPLRIVSGRQS